VDFAALDREDEDETTLVIGSWRFAGMGWLTDDDAALAMAAATHALERASSKRRERPRR